MLVHIPNVIVKDGSGYTLTDPQVDTDLSDFSSDVSITREGLVRYTRAPNGLHCLMRLEGDAVLLNMGERASTISISLNVSDLVRYQGNVANVQFNFHDGPVIVSVLFGLGFLNTTVTYAVDDGVVKEIVFGDLLIDRPDDADLLVQVTEGGIRSGLNGIEEFQPFDSLLGFEPHRSEVKVSAGQGISSFREVALFRVQASRSDGYQYVDTLHKTIVPDGKDFAFSMHIHADKAYIQHFEVMANLSNEIGLKGTYDAWWQGNSQQYGMESPEYVAALHALQDSGWDIGMHAGSINDMTREQVIATIENMTAELGDMRTWSDHGARQQDIWKNGTNESSPFYNKDLIIGIGAAWVNNKTHSHSMWNDINRQGMSYTLPELEGLPLFRVSKQQALYLYYEQGRQQDLSSWLRAMPAQRSVFIAHDYFPFFCYVSNATGNYSVLPAHDGIANTPWSQLVVKRDFTNASWHALPRFVEFLEFARDHNAWFATVREVYDRSSLVQKIVVKETAKQVSITNFNTEAVEGLTLYSRGDPQYQLAGAGSNHIPQKGAGGSWHFVFDLGPGEEMVLYKVGSLDHLSYDLIVPAAAAMIAVRESWPGA